MKVAFYLATGCSGCELSILDYAEVFEEILDFDVVWAPLFEDSRLEDLEKIDEIDVSFVEGGVSNEEQIRVVRTLRKKSKKLVALGTCASFGGVPGLINLNGDSFASIFGKVKPRTVYREESGELLTLPKVTRVKAIGEVVRVDAKVPGCPPTEGQIRESFKKEGMISSKLSVCSSCPRKPEKFEKFAKVKRSYNQTEKCFLNEGIICFGFSTFGDCKATCPKVGVPCRGCFGSEGDFGARVIDALAPLMSDEALRSLVEEYPNFEKILYAYTLPASVLKGRKK